MKNLRKRFNRFCYDHRNAGIPNLILWIMIAQAIFYVISLSDPSYLLYSVLAFDRTAILHGEVWRLVSFVLIGLSGSNPLLLTIFVICYYQIGKVLESVWGTLRLNLYYLTGVVLLIAAGFIFDISITVTSLNLSLFLAYATMFPDAQFMIFFVIPVKARWLGILDLAYSIIGIFEIFMFPYNLIPLFILGNYLLHFGKGVLNLFPYSWQINLSRLGSRLSGKKRKVKQPKVIPMDAYYAPKKSTQAGSYRHRCTVCGRTDSDHPDLEFRYCSKCKGYHCYCMDHINNHAHIDE